MASRTKKGNVTSEERKKSGGGKDIKKESFPIFDEKSCMSALKLRGHASNPSAVIAKARAWATRNKNSRCLAAAKAASS